MCVVEAVSSFLGRVFLVSMMPKATLDEVVGLALLKVDPLRGIPGEPSLERMVKKRTVSSYKLLFGATVTSQISGLFEQRANLI